MKTSNQLTPVDVVRGEYGFWIHPVLDKYLTEILGEREFMTESEHSKMALHFNVHFYRKEMERDCSEELAEKYWGDGDIDAVKDWQPTPPPSGRWFLVSINDTDDGPVAWFAKEIHAEGEVA